AAAAHTGARRHIVTAIHRGRAATENDIGCADAGIRINRARTAADVDRPCADVAGKYVSAATREVERAALNVDPGKVAGRSRAAEGSTDGRGSGADRLLPGPIIDHADRDRRTAERRAGNREAATGRVIEGRVERRARPAVDLQYAGRAERNRAAAAPAHRAGALKLQRPRQRHRHIIAAGGKR